MFSQKFIVIIFFGHNLCSRQHSPHVSVVIGNELQAELLYQGSPVQKLPHSETPFLKVASEKTRMQLSDLMGDVEKGGTTTKAGRNEKSILKSDFDNDVNPVSSSNVKRKKKPREKDGVAHGTTHRTEDPTSNRAPTESVTVAKSLQLGRQKGVGGAQQKGLGGKKNDGLTNSVSISRVGLSASPKSFRGGAKGIKQKGTVAQSMKLSQQAVSGASRISAQSTQASTANNTQAEVKKNISEATTVNPRDHAVSVPGILKKDTNLDKNTTVISDDAVDKAEKTTRGEAGAVSIVTASTVATALEKKQKTDPVAAKPAE